MPRQDRHQPPAELVWSVLLARGVRDGPHLGSALLFFDAIRHEGREVTRGQYVLRSDVMYER